MQDKTIDIQEIIKVETLPKIFYQLEEIGKQVDLALNGIEDLQCTEENKKEVKKRKQEITAFKNMMEDRRKEIKRQVMEKYEEFNDKYELEVKGKLENAENILNTKVKTIENQQLEEKTSELREFAQEYFESNDIHNLVAFEDIKLNITLSASVKSLKEQVVAFVERIVNDLNLIALEEYKEEILVEYKSNLDFTKSKLSVITRHKQIEELQKRNQELEQQKIEEQKRIEEIERTIEEITEPVPIEEEIEETLDEVITVQFTVKGTKTKIKELKDKIIELGLEWE